MRLDSYVRKLLQRDAAEGEKKKSASSKSGEAKEENKLGGTKALFEIFYWRRVCFDEFHEVVRISGDKRLELPVFHALHALRGRFLWGLTATPLLSSSQAVAGMASLLHSFISPDDPQEAQRWLDTWVRSNTWDSKQIPLTEHWVEVILTKAEKALYLNQRNNWAHLGGLRSEEAHLGRGSIGTGV